MKTPPPNLPTVTTLFFVIFCLFIFTPFWSTAQSNSDVYKNYTALHSATESEFMSPVKSDNKSEKAEATNTIATYQTGKSDFDHYISQHIIYPESAKTYAFEGTTVVRFKVMSDGTLDQFVVIQSTHPICDNEVIRTLQQMPRWNAARKNGESIESLQQIAVDFRLN